jgi:L-lactate dehydrogenase (cytochrome)/(S)-mandelate dehydrogenase
MIGPTGRAGLFWPEGECAAARAAAKAGTAYCLSHGSVCTLEALAETKAAPRWMQVFIYKDRGFTEELASRAAATGYDALVLTIDTQLLGKRERAIVNGFSIPPRFRPLDMAAMALKLAWLRRMKDELPRLTFGNYVRAGEAADIRTLAGRMNTILDPGCAGATSSGCAACGAAPWSSRASCIPRRRGSPWSTASTASSSRTMAAAARWCGRVVHGLAARGRGRPGPHAGADRRRHPPRRRRPEGAGHGCHVLPHRPTAALGLSVAGEAGVAHVLEIFAQELDRAMGLSGIERIDQIGPDLVAPAAARRRAAVAERQALRPSGSACPLSRWWLAARQRDRGHAPAARQHGIETCGTGRGALRLLSFAGAYACRESCWAGRTRSAQHAIVTFPSPRERAPGATLRDEVPVAETWPRGSL